MKRFANKCHYFLKYVVLALPIIILIISLFCGIDYSVRGTHDFDKVVQFGESSWYYNFTSLEWNYFWNNDLNIWYTNLMISLDINVVDIYDSSAIFTNLIYYPLWIIWVYLIDIILDVVVFLPKLGHKMIERFGGIND